MSGRASRVSDEAARRNHAPDRDEVEHRAMSSTSRVIRALLVSS